MAFDKKDYQKIYKTEEMGKVLAHIRGMKDHEIIYVSSRESRPCRPPSISVP